MAARLLILLSCIFSSCALFSQGQDTVQILRGTIAVVGNEPFAHLALQVDSVRTCLLQSTQEIEHTLYSHQGQKAELRVQWVRKEPEGDLFRVLSAQILEE
jgi:hypothetical protein